jgi:deoxyribodipyrimidine photolyase
MHEALSSGLDLAFVYYSPWYYSSASKKRYSEPGASTELHNIAIQSFAEDLRDRGNHITLCKVSDPAQHLVQLAKDNPHIKRVYWDLPLFAPSWEPPEADLQALDVDVIAVDSDLRLPDVPRRQAKATVRLWLREPVEPYCALPKEIPSARLSCDDEFEAVMSGDMLTMRDIRDYLKGVILSNIEARVDNYDKTRDSYGGSIEASCFLHHGILDPVSIITNLIAEKDPDKIYALLRQFAFREMSIRKARRHGLNLSHSVDEWARAIMDDKSYQNIVDVTFEPENTVDELYAGRTNDEELNWVITRAKADRWMPNRARMWFAGEAYYRLGGGLHSLEALINFFDTYIDDGQSPNNYVNCASSLSLSYGRVVRLNRERAIKKLGVRQLMDTAE